MSNARKTKGSHSREKKETPHLPPNATEGFQQFKKLWEQNPAFKQIRDEQDKELKQKVFDWLDTYHCELEKRMEKVEERIGVLERRCNLYDKVIAEDNLDVVETESDEEGEPTYYGESQEEKDPISPLSPQSYYKRWNCIPESELNNLSEKCESEEEEEENSCDSVPEEHNIPIQQIHVLYTPEPVD